MSADFEMFLRGKGIAHTTSRACAKAINGVAERRIGMITDIARYYMLLSGAPPAFWPYAIQHAAGALNFVVHGGSAAPPLEIITGSRQRVMNHLPFGCAAVITRQVRERDNRLVARGEAGIYVGRAPGIIGAYLVWLPARGNITATADVRFDDEAFPWAVGAGKSHPPSIVTANRLRLEALRAARQGINDSPPSVDPLLPTSTTDSPPLQPPPPHLIPSTIATPLRPPDALPPLRPVLHLFSGRSRPNGLSAHLQLYGIPCVDIDVARDERPGSGSDAIFGPLVAAIRRGEYRAVVMDPPSAAFNFNRLLDESISGPPVLRRPPTRRCPTRRPVTRVPAGAIHLTTSLPPCHRRLARLRRGVGALCPRQPLAVPQPLSPGRHTGRLSGPLGQARFAVDHHRHRRLRSPGSHQSRVHHLCPMQPRHHRSGIHHSPLLLHAPGFARSTRAVVVRPWRRVARRPYRPGSTRGLAATPLRDPFSRHSRDRLVQTMRHIPSQNHRRRGGPRRSPDGRPRLVAVALARHRVRLILG